jgi:hypothetical protein
MKKLKYILNDFRWLKVLNSPFKPFKVKFYVGKTKIGTPYFLPRKWVKDKEKPGYLKPVPLKVGFSYCGLGWKTKWTDTDFRYEWNPMLSFVFFGYQIALIVYHKDSSHYWESWLYYEYATDKSKSKRERIEQCRKEAPQTWSVYKGDTKESVDYYTRILKLNYL